jgi:hypothetical protein
MPSPRSARGPSPRASGERQLGELLPWLARSGAQPRQDVLTCDVSACLPARPARRRGLCCVPWWTRRAELQEHSEVVVDRPALMPRTVASARDAFAATRSKPSTLGQVALRTSAHAAGALASRAMT